MIATASDTEATGLERLQVILTCANTSHAEATISLELCAGLHPGEAERRLAQANRAGDMGARAVSFYLVDLADRGAHQELGFHCVVQYAETRFGIQPRTTREYLAIGRALDELPQIDRALREGRLFWSQTRLLARIATPETEAAWLEWAGHRTVRQIAAHVRQREKGDLPADPARRRIHATTYKVEGRLNAIQWEIWNNARAKIEAETSQPVSDTEMIMQAAMQLLETRPDGSVPGRTPVNDAHYRVVVQVPADGGPAAVRTADGPVELDSDTRTASLGDDEPVPLDQRDKPTPPKVRRKILKRDGFRCVCCGAKKNLTIHHKVWRRFGGPTAPGNLMTLCEDCHSLVHDRKLVIRGVVPDDLRFLDGDGRPIASLGKEVLREMKVGARAPRPRPVSFQDIPSDADIRWWAGHQHLLRWADRGGELEFTPGFPLEELPGDDAGARAPRHDKVAKLDDLVGQEQVVANLRRAVRAARPLGEPPPHILLYGPPGLGKTTLAHAVANELGSRFHGTSAPLLKEPGVLLRLLTSLGASDVVFLDEVHGLPDRVAEVLYEAMENGCLSLPIRCGMHQKTLRLRLPPFTLIGATTQEERLPAPLRSRFKVRQRLEFGVPTPTPGS